MQQHRKLAAGWDVHFASNLPHAQDEIHHPAHLGFGLRVRPDLIDGGEGRAHESLAGRAGAGAHALPDFLADERRQWMQRAQQRLQHPDQREPRAALVGFARGVRLQHGLGKLQIPVAVIVPGEIVEGGRHHVEPVVGKTRLHARDGRGQTRRDPSVREAQAHLGCGQVLSFDVHQDVARSVPELVAEITVVLDPGHVETQVAALRRHGGEAQPQRVGPVRGDALRKLFAGGLLDGGFHLRLHQPAGALGQQVVEADAVDDVQGVDHVALRLGHLLSVVVADQAVHVHLAEGHLIGELEGHHDHAGHPEKDDVEARDQHRGRIIGAQRRRVFGPPLRGKRPQRRGEPGVEYVLVLTQSHRVVETMLGAGLCLVVRHVPASLVVVPGWYAVAPPELPADAPVLDVAHPLEVHAGPGFRHETHAAVGDGADGGLGQRLDVDEPLIGQQRLQDGVAAVAARHGECVRFDVRQQSQRVEIGDHPRARSHALEAAIRLRHHVVQRGVWRHDVDQRQTVTLPHLVIVEIMRRRDLHAAAAERGVHVSVADDGNVASRQRQAYLPADEMPVAFVVGVDGHGRIAQHRLRAGGRDDQLAVAVRQRIAQMP